MHTIETAKLIGDLFNLKVFSFSIPKIEFKLAEKKEQEKANV